MDLGLRVCGCWGLGAVSVVAAAVANRVLVSICLYSYLYESWSKRKNRNIHHRHDQHHYLLPPQLEFEFDPRASERLSIIWVAVAASLCRIVVGFWP